MDQQVCSNTETHPAHESGKMIRPRGARQSVYIHYQCQGVEEK